MNDHFNAPEPNAKSVTLSPKYYVLFIILEFVREGTPSCMRIYLCH